MQKLRQAFLFYLLPILVLIFFALIMNSTSFFQKSFRNDDHFSTYVVELEEMIQIQDWEAAQSSLSKMHTAWKQISPRLQLAAEKDKLEELDENLARLSALVSCQDQSSALSELYAAANNWRNISR